MIHLHLHSHFSTLDGLGKVKDIVARAKEINAPAVAITDHASISAMPELFKECEKVGIKPIIGCEFYVVEDAESSKHESRRHLTVLAKSWQGVESIMRQLTIANKQFYRRPRLTYEQALEFKDCIVMSACAFGLLSCDDWKEKAHQFYRRYKHDFYLEIMPLEFEPQREINKRAIILRLEAGFQLVATNDCHYVAKDDTETHAVLIAIQFGKKWDDPDRKDFGEDIYMRNIDEMVEAFRRTSPEVDLDSLRDAMVNLGHVADKINVVRPETPVELPNPDPATPDTIAFKNRLWGGLTTKLGHVLADAERRKVYNERLAYEIDVIKKLGYIRYFLIVEDIIRWSRENDIMVGPARGSSCGSLICYCMDITQLDPIEHGLIFERFLNPHRHDLPDIDIDFQDDRREEVFNYIRAKYGEDYTAYINTFGRLTLKSAFRDCCRVFSVDHFTTNNLSKLVETVQVKAIDEDGVEYMKDVCPFEHHGELIEFAKKHPEVVKHAKRLDGTIRQQGVHAAGMIVSNRRLDDVSVIERRRNDTEVVNWDKRECEGFGLLKMDILGLSTLTILSNAQKFIRENHGVEIVFTDIPLTDPKTLAAFSRGEGAAVFQFENDGMQNLLRDLQASDFETITATTALYRPGSLESGETNRFVRIHKGEEYERYPHELAKPILGATKGIMVYQEQVMRIASELAGFTLPEADTLRKIIGKKLGKEEFEKHRGHFVEGCATNGVESDAANAIFSKMVEFSGYAFNKSHAAAYTVISFWCMYLKVHYPLEFLAAAMTSAKDDRRAALVKEVQRLGMQIAMPDINLSRGQTFHPNKDSNQIVAPLTVIKGVGPAAVDTIMQARKDGPFIRYEDFLDRIDKRRCNIRVQETLQRAGVFEGLGIREADEAQRAKNFAELVPVFNALPSLTLDNVRMDKKELATFIAERRECMNLIKGKDLFMPPKLGRQSPSIMVVNNHQTNEDAPLTQEGTKFLMACLKDRGIAPSNIYYTSPVKCRHGKKKPPKTCEAKCWEALGNEIKIVRPKLIICCANQLVHKLSGEKVSIGKVHNKVIYSKEYDAYILFSYSPQYAAFNEDITPKFWEAMDTAAEIFAADITTKRAA